MDDVRVADARIHQDLVLAAERIRDLRPLLQDVPAVEDVLGSLDGAPREAGGLEVADRPSRAVGDPADEELRVVPVERLLAACGGRGVGVGGREEKALRREAGFVGRKPPGLVEHVARDAHVVADREDEGGLAVVEAKQRAWSSSWIFVAGKDQPRRWGSPTAA
jgi:hypothetical protein